MVIFFISANANLRDKLYFFTLVCKISVYKIFHPPGNTG